MLIKAWALIRGNTVFLHLISGSVTDGVQYHVSTRDSTVESSTIYLQLLEYVNNNYVLL